MNIERLRQRAAIVSSIRRFFDERGFVEIETPVRISAPAPEEHIDCPRTEGGAFLRASPELQMKKLLAAGMDRIYQIGPCFREGEKGSRHNPEFTMIEWYRRGEDYLAIADDLESLMVELRRSRGDRPTISSCAVAACVSADSSLPTFNFNRLTVREAYRKFAGWDPFLEFDQDRFDYDMATKVEPAIKEAGGGVFLIDYPKEAASLAKLAERGDGTVVAERWEFYYDGLELANCFTELCDGAEQRRRFEKARLNRRALGEADYPIDEEFLNSLDLIGSAAGVALGVDRLVMTILNEREIMNIRVGE